LAKFRNIFVLFFAAVLIFSSGCGKKSDEKTNSTGDKMEFGWKDNITSADIPDFPVKGYIGGKEVQFAYINFEKWRGANDNVINFSLVKPAQNCGFIENFEGFTILNKGNQIKQGPFVKSKFSDDPASYQVSFKQGGSKSGDPWNMALEIESISDKTVKGKIVLFFNDNSKSWLAGKFEAVICNN
jgi:hypothetical protein